MAKKIDESRREYPRLVEKVYAYGDRMVGVRIDYRKEQISLIDGNSEPERYVFAERGVEDMDGWLDILKAVEYAITKARGELQSYLDERTKELALAMAVDK